MIFVVGFKQFNSILRRSEHRQDQAQGISGDCQSKHKGPSQYEI